MPACSGRPTFTVRDIACYLISDGELHYPLVFPVRTRVDGRGQQSIHQRRGTHQLIRDRFDLTLECIRRHYAGLGQPA
jgi:hypothetical protein